MNNFFLHDDYLLHLLKLRKKDLKKKISLFSNLDSIEAIEAVNSLSKKFKIKINITKIIEIDNLVKLKKYLKI